jgi:hypothetical protein
MAVLRLNSSSWYAVWALSSICGPALAQEPAPIGIVRGDLVKWDGTASRGQIDVLAPDAKTLTCGFDAKTYFERDNQRIAPAAMAPGDRVEIVADRKPGTIVCYARTVHVIDQTVLRRPPGSRLRSRESSNPTEMFAPRGDLTFAGVVVRVDPDSFIIKTRAGGETTLLLRADTRFFSEGLRVEPATLKLQTRVFVRGGKNLDGEVEAYQIVWGGIVQPR